MRGGFNSKSSNKLPVVLFLISSVEVSIKTGNKLLILLDSSGNNVDFCKTGNKLLNMNKESVGDTIRKRRKFLKITQEDLSDIAGVSERTLRNIEKGLANPELESLMDLLDVLGLEMKIRVIK